MLPATDAEIEHIKDYMQTEAPDLTVTFLQKMYSENVLKIAHDVWDVHTNVDRWWVITEPTNLYAQAQFPNMDLALTFHVGWATTEMKVREVNANRQRFLAPTGRRGTTHPFATIWRMRCEKCGHEYGSNSCDAHIRRCPAHAGGKPGEPL